MSERSDAIGALYGAMHKLNELGDDDVLLTIICGTLEDLRTKPLPVLTDLAHDADMWADLAAPVELEAYLTAIGRRLPETPMHHAARKRIIAGLFRAMSIEDRKRFIEWATQHQDDPK